MSEYRIGRLNGRFVVNIYDDAGNRTHRYRLDARDKSAAERQAPGIVSALTKPIGKSVREIWDAFKADRDGRAIIATMVHTWKAIEHRFGTLDGDAITVEDCRAHTATRRKAGVKDGTISTELGHLRMVLRWAEKRGMIRAPYIERPSAPRRKEIHLTRKQCRALIDAATMPHIRLYILLALATGGRNEALLELTWNRCNFERGLIDLRNPEINRPHKGRAIVPMNRTIRAALTEARDGALSDIVIEWAGGPIKSVKKGIKASARAAGIKTVSVSPHIFRHSAAVHMAEAGISMEVIAQYLGHDDVNVTRKKYARYSPTYLREAAAALEFDDLGSMNLKSTTFSDENAPEVPDFMVADAVLVEPVSTHEFPANREINREFRRIRTFGANLKADTGANSKASSEIPYSGEQGIISAEQGILV
jgi:integrase